MLGHSKVIEAITLCQKRRGQWRAGLSPSSIPGIDFFNAAVAAVHERESVGVGYTHHSNQHQQHQQCEGDADPDPFVLGPGERVEMMHTVFKFISEWDHSSLSTSGTGKSRMASQTQFKFVYTPYSSISSTSHSGPGGWEEACCFNEVHTAIFNEQFGLV